MAITRLGGHVEELVKHEGLEPVSDWPEKLTAAFKAEFGEDQ